MRWVFARGMLLVPACAASLMSTTPTHDTSFLPLVTYSPRIIAFVNTNYCYQISEIWSQETWTLVPALLLYWRCDMDQVIQTFWTSGSLAINTGIIAVLKGLLGRLSEIVPLTAKEWEVFWVEWSRLMKTRPDLRPLKVILPCWGMCRSKSRE